MINVTKNKQQKRSNYKPAETSWTSHGNDASKEDGWISHAPLRRQGLIQVE